MNKSMITTLALGFLALPLPGAANASAAETTPAPECSESAALAGINGLAQKLNPYYGDANTSIAESIISIARGCPSSEVKTRAAQGLRSGIRAEYFGTTTRITQMMRELCGGDRACAKAAVESIGSRLNSYYQDSTEAMAGDIGAIVEQAPDPEVKLAAARMLTSGLNVSYDKSARTIGMVTSWTALSHECSEPAALESINGLAQKLNPYYGEANGDIAQAIITIGRGCASSYVKTRAAQGLSAGMRAEYNGTTVGITQKMRDLCGADRACAEAAVESIGSKLNSYYQDSTEAMAGDLAVIVERAPSSSVKSAAATRLAGALNPSYDKSSRAISAAMQRVARCGS